jgi:phosphate transport system substrate-binding protein
LSKPIEKALRRLRVGPIGRKQGAHNNEVLEFFRWAYSKGAKTAEELDYVPLPGAVVKLIEQSWQSSKLGLGSAVVGK